MGNHMIFLFYFTVEYVCTYRSPYSHYQGNHEVPNCMRFFSFIYSAFCLKDIHWRGKVIQQLKHRLCFFISRSLYVLFYSVTDKRHQLWKRRPTDFCILKKCMNFATYHSIQSSPAGSLTLTLTTETQNILHGSISPTKSMTYYTFFPHIMQTLIFWSSRTIICLFSLVSSIKDTVISGILQKWVLEFH